MPGQHITPQAVQTHQQTKVQRLLQAEPANVVNRRQHPYMTTLPEANKPQKPLAQSNTRNPEFRPDPRVDSQVNNQNAAAASLNPKAAPVTQKEQMNIYTDQYGLPLKNPPKLPYLVEINRDHFSYGTKSAP